MPQHHDSASLATTLQHVVAGSSSSDKDDTASDSDFQLKPSSIQLQTASEFTGGGAQYVQYSNDGQLFVPVTVSGVAVSDLQTYQLRPAQVTTGAPVVVAASGIGVGVGSVGLQTTGSTQSVPIAEDAARKREMRLLKNREAAKECRRKKKDYIKCLENRVAVLENQNATLIEELKALKDLYCKKSVNDM
ncbi:cAMP-responsive element modulator-like [Tropilaelaps mercedesae]|uniref:cAMP-responsive element modulator-like n=1 Tax=Tropilaelaps mercedesae TaxID=418985 RepID=A0A1V9Y361_9ACAR|nr:cAMP-responsive element modulator-like [Tropilaelaps mercedesae]